MDKRIRINRILRAAGCTNVPHFTVKYKLVDGIMRVVGRYPIPHEDTATYADMETLRYGRTPEELAQIDQWQQELEQEY